MDDKIETSAEQAEKEAIPRRGEVHADPDKPSGEQPLPENMANGAAKPKSPAQWAYERIILYLKNFEETLDNEQEAAMGFTGSDSGVIRIEGLGYFDPDIVTFYGSDPTGARTQLIQHVSQLNVMLRAVPKAVERPEAMRIGFRLAQELDETQG